MVSDEDIADIWEAAKQEAIDKVRGTKSSAAGAESPMIDDEEVEKPFWMSRPDGWGGE